MRLRVFPEQVGPQILLLESLINLEQVVHFSGKKKTKNLKQQNFDGEDNWSGVLDFHCMQMSLVMSMRFILGDY